VCELTPRKQDLDTRSPNLDGAQRLGKLVKDAVNILDKGLPAKQAWLSQHGTTSGEHIASSSMRLYYMINRLIQDVNSLPNNPPPVPTGWGRGDDDEIIADRVADPAPEPVPADTLWKAMAVMDFVSAPPEPEPVTEAPPAEASS
jgi:hypothetical protein